MPTSLRVLAFAVAVLLAGAAGWVAGDTVGPEAPGTTVTPHEHTEVQP